MANFEVFTRRATPAAKGPTVTVQRQGNISLNYAAFEAMGEPDMVELLYDREDDVMGLRTAQDNSPHAYRLRKQSSGSGFVISGRAFTQHYDIKTDAARRFRAELNDDGILTVDLKAWSEEPPMIPWDQVWKEAAE
jgi:hypothetical protein